MQPAQPTQPTQPSSLEPGNCEQCRKPLDSLRFCLWYDFAKKRRSCEHIVCGTCRGIMMGWARQHCPVSDCNKRFCSIQDAVSPSTATIEEFFKFVNYTETGRISKDELVAWYITNFDTTWDDAMANIDCNWQLWDVPKNRSFLGWVRPKDQGDLDMDEFPPVQEFMKNSLARSFALSPVAAATSSTAVSSEPRGKKRCNAEVDNFTEGVLRNVAQKKQVHSDELQQKLSNNNDKGREWLDDFDFDKSGKLSKEELTTALLQTLIGSHRITGKEVAAIVDGCWDAIDTDGGGSVDFDEFQGLREPLMAQLHHDRDMKAVA